MTTLQSDILNDERYIPIAEHGFVGLVETMGSDEAIEQAARVSYGKGTRKVSDTRNLIRYLLRNRHISPFEMGEVKFHVKLPIFVMRQLVRHRTASLNEYSARYSELSDEHYHPNPDRIQAQSKTNLQSREGDLAQDVKDQWGFECHRNRVAAQQTYRDALSAGVPRELARINLPLSVYTELYWKIDLNNFMKFLTLRLHPHAQREMRDYAWSMYELSSPHFPLTFEAFEDYMLNARIVSRMEAELLRDIMAGVVELPLNDLDLPGKYGLSKREWKDFLEVWATPVEGMMNLKAAAERYKQAVSEGRITSD